MTDYQPWIGRSERRADILSEGLLARFCATTGAGPQSPLGVHWCLCLPDAAMSELGADGHPKKGGFLPPIPQPRRMWASSDVEFAAPLAVGARVERVSTIRAITEKSGKSGSLVFVDVAHETMCAGALAIRETQTLVYRDASPAKTPLPADEGADVGQWPRRKSLTPSPALLFRYSALTFNSHRIHYDLPYAREVENYPALVVHGPLLATLLLAHAQGGRRERLTRFSFRGVSPAFCGQPLHLVADAEGTRLAAIGGDGRTLVEANAAFGD